ncbi:hypothetical protein [Actinacidiphila sp. bgisy167]|uniref:hypothetical protein n=1 Tax=Actinacidiphila sp. bgisy167 TaxID=3413797 RepID=UPI003D73F1C2
MAGATATEARRAHRAPAPLRLLASETASAALLSVPVVWLGGSYPLAWLCVAGAGAAPVLVTACSAGRPDPEGRTGWAPQRQVAFRISVVTIAASGVVFAGALLAHGTGLMGEYPSAARVRGSAG